MSGDGADSTDWMTAYEALHLVCERNGATLGTRPIINRAGNGLLRSWATLFRTNGRQRDVDVANDELPVSFWKGRLEKSDWAAGDFQILASDRRGYTFERQHAFGVMFDRAGIEAMLAPPTSATAPRGAVESNGGGRPPALDWEEAALEMAGRYYRGDLKPGSVADVIRAIQKWANKPDGGPPEATVRPHAKLMFEAFKAWEAD